MITCVVSYVIDPAKIDAFEQFGRRWMDLVFTLQRDQAQGYPYGAALGDEEAAALARQAAG